MLRSFALALMVVAANVGAAERFDVVIRGGRVMDPETGRDGVFDVAVIRDRIARISAEPLEGARLIDARGLVVAPGFIDLHQHSFSRENDQLKVRDGVTTALEMEIGRSDVAAFLAERRGHALVHFGATASHPAARHAAWGGSLAAEARVPPSGASTNQSASPERMTRILERLDREITAGGLGIGMGLQYTPGATRQEVIEAFRLAAARRLPVFTHVRSAGRIEPGSSIESVGEVIAAAATTGASLQIVHINSSRLRDAPECLALVAGARARGLDVTTEAYPYEAGMTLINSALFNPGWREKLGIDYREGRLQEGADADIVVFDPETIADRATYAKATEPSVGVRYLLVAGTVVVDAGRVVPGVAPGRALVSGR